MRNYKNEVIIIASIFIKNIIIKKGKAMSKKIFLTTLLLWIMVTSVRAAVWKPEWAWNKVNEHVQYKDNSENCISEEDGFPQFLSVVDDSNDFGYYMYRGQNSKTNPGTLNVEYFILDKVTLKPGASYTLKFGLYTNRTYKNLEGSNVRVLLKDAPNADAKVLQDFGDIDPYFNCEGTPKAQTFNIESAPAECYVCLKVTGKLIGTIYSVSFCDFSIDEVTPPVPTELPEASIDLDTNNAVVAKEYFTVSGAALGANVSESGFYIVKTVYSNGTVKFTKEQVVK